MVAWQRAVAEAHTVYLGTSFDAELGACPLCAEGSAAAQACFVPTVVEEPGRWKALPGGWYHRERVPAAILERAQRHFEALAAALRRDRFGRMR